ncbi:hypothetical protein BHU24_08190 [Bacillus pseudomycoides]|uniref:hypothetical protein n=1 Tax=Bacillus pseudomycoides TaxID=64104 RepID=UPI000BF79C22|nr:hypothetical protein [Bacillus pseudomycoides]MBD5795506.1 hypothetical protein [Bacillus pseudomycoides]MED1475960.1 hypothetical protein [Bacillus pseudomycoides]PEO91292.1 hypothetical protein CN571_06330 [Bacillus pseudomycoides]
MPVVYPQGYQRPILHDLMKFKQLIVDEMMRSRFTNVNFYQQGVIGESETNGATVIIQSFMVSGPNRYYQIMVGSGNTLEDAQSVVHAVELIARRIEYPSYIID